ncbi:MAG: hypothetical protein PHT84_03080, partial [Candidatus Pacebacteria bacterium]|nr:hypothetical protein [Candidatus Paceibacterota bacterium]
MGINNKNKIKTNSGAAMMTVVIFFVFISLTILLGIVTPAVREFKISSNNLDSKQTYFLAESGVEDVIYRLKNGLQVESVINLVLGDSSAITTITDLSGGKKQINSLGDTNQRQRRVGTVLTTSAGVSFNYGVQAGQGGIHLDSGRIYGNVYSNGPITATSSGSNIISGSAISANSPNFTSDQENGSGNPSYSVTFSTSQDVAQSFRVSADNNLSKIQFYIKKVGSPNNATVKIVNDNGGSPGTTVLASGTLSASQVTTTYGWVNVSFDSNPNLNSTTTYWAVIDASTSKSKYYIIGASNGGYDNGIGKIGQQGGSWNNTTPYGLDYYFKLYLGGASGLISGYNQWNLLSIGESEPDSVVHANTVNFVNTAGTIYCQSGQSNIKNCDTSRPDPVYIDFPISEGNLLGWENEASAGGTYSGNYSVGWDGANLGPKKIEGNLTVSSGGTLNITGNLWVTGNLVLNGGAEIKLDTSYGLEDAVVVVDGTVSVSGGGHATGSGSLGSYI